MNNRLQQQQTQQAGLHQQAETEGKQAFETAEAVIAADRAQTPVPERLGERIAESIAQETPGQGQAPRPWWRRLFGG